MSHYDELVSESPYNEQYKSTRAAVARLLTSLGIDWEKDPNFKETPGRVATWLSEKFLDETSKEAKRQLLAKKVFPSNYSGVVAQTGIRAYGLCPHHLLPVIYTVALGYLPSGFVIGLSKLARLADLELGSVGTQEDLTERLADSLCVILHTQDVAVVVKGVHQCMLVRGVKQQAAITETSEMRGKFRRDEGGIKAEFMSLARNGGNAK